MSEGKKEILLGDCLELMKDIPNGSIDMILCDLPYGTTACKWDCVLPLEKLWIEYKRILKTNGAIVLTASQPFTSVLTCSNLDWFKYEWIWLKNQGSNFATVKYQPMKEHESILVFAKGKTIYNPIMQPRTKSAQERLKYDITEYKGDKREVFGGLKDNGKNMSYNKEERNPASYQFFEVVPRHKGTLHPTQKPTELFEYLVKTYTNEGDLVLDNTAGSGTTAIACLNTNRQFIVMEKEQKYYDIILKRVGDFNKKFEPQTLFGNEM
jgi:site-specific DNA-methyltransferase (adenine-specific)